jgi:protein-tyrosine phosphatase
LDAHAPSDCELRELVAEIVAHPGRVYVHCAHGYGRTGLVVTAVVLARGGAETPAEAIAAVRAVRRGVRLMPSQLAALERFAKTLTRRAVESPGVKPS